MAMSNPDDPRVISRLSTGLSGPVSAAPAASVSWFKNPDRHNVGVAEGPEPGLIKEVARWGGT